MRRRLRERPSSRSCQDRLRHDPVKGRHACNPKRLPSNSPLRGASRERLTLPPFARVNDVASLPRTPLAGSTSSLGPRPRSLPRFRRRARFAGPDVAVRLLQPHLLRRRAGARRGRSIPTRRSRWKREPSQTESACTRQLRSLRHHVRRCQWTFAVLVGLLRRPAHGPHNPERRLSPSPATFRWRWDAWVKDLEQRARAAAGAPLLVSLWIPASPASSTRCGWNVRAVR